MISEKNCIRIGEGLNITPLIRRLEARPELWDEITVRQDHPDSPHIDTEVIYIRGPKEFSITSVFMDTGAYDYPARNKIGSAIDDLLATVNVLIGIQELGRVIIAKLKAGGVVTEHIDRGDYAKYYQRYHIPLITNDRCFNNCWGQDIHWKEGDLMWFNHRRRHSAYNLGNEDRVHLIIDAKTEQL
jgi:hypothetical protein